MKSQSQKKYTLKVTVFTAFAALLVTAGIGLANLLYLNVEPVSAATTQQQIDACINSSKVPNVQSVKDACNFCYTSGSSIARGTMWITSDPSGNSDVVYANSASGTVDARLWGKVYACGQTTANPNGAINQAYYYWFGAAGKDRGNSSKGTLEGKVDFIESNVAQKTLYRGWLGHGQRYVWYSTQNDNFQIVRIDVAKFISYVKNTNPSGVYEPGDGSPRRYSAQVSVNRCFKDIGAYRNPDPSGACYGTDSTIVLELPGEPDKPDEPEPVVEEAGRIRFVSRSTVHTDKQQDVEKHTETSDDNGTDTVKMFLSTDESKVNVQFWHEMRYLRESDNGGPIEPIGGRDRFKNAEYIKTEWTVRRSSDQRPDANADIESGTFSFEAGNPNGIPFKAAGGRHNYTIDNIQPGDTIEICEKINFHNVIFPLQREEVKKKVNVNVYESTGTDIGQGVFIMTPTEDTNASGVGVTANGELGVFRSASSSEYYHYEQKWVPDQWGGGYWESVEVSGGKIGESIYPREPGVILYTYAFDGIGEYTGQAVYAWKNGEENLGHDNIRYYSYIGSDSPHHWNYDGQLVPGADEWGYAVSSDGGSLMVRRQDEIHDYWLYSPIEGADYDDGNGWSEACISVTRPKEPAKPSSDPYDDLGLVSGPISGSPNEGFMYAGEDADARWSVGAIGYATRRIMQSQAILYQPTVNTRAQENVSKGNMDDYKEMQKNRDDPCAWYRKRVASSGGALRGNVCAEIYEGSEYYGSDGFYGVPYEPKKIEKQANIIVSDEVGDKLCNSFGFEFSYWYGVTHSNPASEIWKEEGRRYWAIYDAACRTIVKKPSLNLWNGSLFTNGNVQTTIANRYLSPVLGGTLANPRGSGVRRDFGSWSEYLAVVGGSIRGNSAGGFGSGSSLSFAGIFGTGDSLLKNISPLTISNKSPSYGYSGVEAGSTFRARLNTYLKPLSTTSSVTGLQNVNETIIVDAGGVANITENITLSSRAYASVYQLPQIIIFADDINISGNVTQIDAWLIAKNNINTCSEFVSGEGKTPSSHSESEAGTEAHIAGYNNDAVCSKQLTVNGPIISGSIELNRSHGSDPLTDSDVTVLGGGTNTRAIPGEAFNLSADSYLWAYAQAGRYDSSYTEAYTRELPPRY